MAPGGDGPLRGLARLAPRGHAARVIYRLLADATVALHLLFIAFVAAGGLLVLRRPRLAWVHLPCAAYGALVELLGWICPLTPLENRLRGLGGEAGYRGGFVERYLLPVLYPQPFPRWLSLALGAAVIAANAAVYAAVLARARHGPSRSPAPRASREPPPAQPQPRGEEERGRR